MSDQRPVRPSGQPVRPGVPPTQRPPGPGPQQRPQGPPGSGPQQRPQGPPGSGPQQRPQGPPGSGPQQRPQGPPGSGPPQRPQGPVMPQPGQPQQRPSGPPQRPSCPTQRPVGPPGQDQPSQRPARPARPQTPQGLQGSRFPNGSGGGRMPTVGIPPRSQRVSPVLTAAVAAAGPPQRETGAIPKQLTAGMERLSIATPAATSQTETKGTSSGSGRGMGRAKDPRERDHVLMTRNADFNKKGGKGLPGQPVQHLNLLANYFSVTNAGDSKIDVIVRQYQVDFYPQDDNTTLKKKLFRQAMQDEPCNYVFDGMQMFTVFTFGDNVSKVVEDEHGNRFHINVRFICEVGPDSMQYEQFLNILLRTCLEKLRLVNIKADYFDPAAKIELSNLHLEIWPGYKTALAHHDLGPLLNVDVGFKVLRTDNVLAVARTIRNRAATDFVSELKRALIGQTVVTRYNNRIYRIDDIDMSTNATTFHFLWTERSVSLADYMMIKYHIAVTDPKQFLLVSHPTRQDVRRGHNTEHYLLPEFCFLTGLSEDMRGNFRLMQDVQSHTRKDPSQRVQTLLRFAQRLMSSTDVQTALSRCGVSVADNLVAVGGRLLPPEPVNGGAGQVVTYRSSNADWGSILKRAIYSGVPCQKWAVVYYQKDKQMVDTFLDACRGSANSMGIVMDRPNHVVLDQNTISSYILNMKDLIKKAPNLIMTFVPNNRGDLYKAVKTLCYVDAGMPSQVITMTVLNKAKNLHAIASKVVAQVEAKLGGQLWNVRIPPKGLMVIGYDAWADKSGATLKNKVSIGAVVCTTNHTQTTFLSFAVRHSNQEELCAKLQTHIRSALEVYRNNTGAFPSMVIFYRDGIGEGQIAQSIEIEVNPIYNLLTSINPNVRFSFIVVSKRINTKFFLKKDDKYFNPEAGTVVDDVVTKPERYDFFLVSLSVNKGTVNPTSYNVIKDTTGINPDQMQALTYKMTHLYYNWPGTVRVPAVCLYAHKLAYLVGESLNDDPISRIDWSSRLYYL